MQTVAPRILVVEDDEAQARLITIAIERHVPGVSVTSVGTAQEAIKAMRETLADAGILFDLMILDMRVPGSGARTVLGDIKADERLRTVPVVVFSSSAAPVDIHDACARHANSYVVKPVEHKSFVGALQAVCDYWLKWHEPAPSVAEQTA